MRVLFLGIFVSVSLAFGNGPVEKVGTHAEQFEAKLDHHQQLLVPFRRLYPATLEEPKYVDALLAKMKSGEASADEMSSFAKWNYWSPAAVEAYLTIISPMWAQDAFEKKFSKSAPVRDFLVTNAWRTFSENLTCTRVSPSVIEKSLEAARSHPSSVMRKSILGSIRHSVMLWRYSVHTPGVKWGRTLPDSISSNKMDCLWFDPESQKVRDTLLQIINSDRDDEIKKEASEVLKKLEEALRDRKTGISSLHPKEKRTEMHSTLEQFASVYDGATIQPGSFQSQLAKARAEDASPSDLEALADTKIWSVESVEAFLAAISPERAIYRMAQRYQSRDLVGATTSLVWRTLMGRLPCDKVTPPLITAALNAAVNHPSAQVRGAVLGDIRRSATLWQYGKTALVRGRHFPDPLDKTKSTCLWFDPNYEPVRETLRYASQHEESIENKMDAISILHEIENPAPGR